MQGLGASYSPSNEPEVYHSEPTYKAREGDSTKESCQQSEANQERKLEQKSQDDKRSETFRGSASFHRTAHKANEHPKSPAVEPSGTKSKGNS
jgi:hypothetical protein